MPTGFRWIRPPSALADDLGVYLDQVQQAIVAVAHYFEPVLESYAKEHAPWTDRTGNARQGLFTATDVATDIVTLYLSHGVFYGIFLELCHGGKYAIIMRTLQAHYAEIAAMLQGIFG